MAILPTFSDITYFLEVAQTKNISRAAERLGITQPSLSSAIKRLEDALSSQLFTRSRSGVQLTKAGDELVTQGRLFLQNWEQLKSEISRRDLTVSGEYIIGCHPSVALSTLPFFLPSLLQKYPDLEIKLAHDLSRKITEEVISHQIDFGIVVNPVKHPDLIIKDLCVDEVSLWVSAKSFPTQTIGNKECVLICDQNLVQTQKILSQLDKKKVSFNRIIQSSNLEVITELTMHGCGVGILPQRVATRHKAFQLKKLGTQFPVFKDHICLISRADSKKTKGREVIMSSIRSAFK